jgi:hypothetical protein
MSAEQEASTEALTHRWDPSGQAAVTRLEAFLQQVGVSGAGLALAAWVVCITISAFVDVHASFGSRLSAMTPSRLSLRPLVTPLCCLSLAAVTLTRSPL